MRIAIFFLSIGVSLLAYAMTLSPYKNEKLFIEQYMKMSAGQSEDYWRLRDEMLTPKYQLEDYGITLIALAIIIFFILQKGHEKLQSPSSRRNLVVLVLALPLITSGGYIFDLFQAYDRGEFPQWSDSLAIPLMGVPIQIIIMLVWLSAHLSFLRGFKYSSAPLIQTLSFKANWWLLFLSIIAFIVFISSAVEGQYWYAIPSLLWLYFYLSVGAVHRKSDGISLNKMN